MNNNKHKIVHQDTLLVIGTMLLIFPLLNSNGIININSDVFWSLVGLGLLTEGLIERRREHEK